MNVCPMTGKAWSWVKILVLLYALMITVDAMLTIELRVDRLNALSYRPSKVTCCYSSQCMCFTKVQGCAFDHTRKSCGSMDLQEGKVLGGLVVGRTASILLLDTNFTSHNLGLNLQLIYAPLSTQAHTVTVLGQFLLDLSELPVGPSRDLTGWATFNLDTGSGVTMTIQAKTYCAASYHGSSCTERCVPESGRYYCDEDGNKICLGLWSGPDCSQVDPCLSFPCLNAGTCIAQGNSFTCVCNPLFTGRDCSLGFDSCNAVPCHNSSTCIDLVGGFRCLCPLERTGRFCETELKDCRKFGCENGGACSLNLDSQTFTCVCPMGFHGNRCQTQTCKSDTCHNGGTCQELRNGTYVCLCRYGFKGHRCEKATSCRLKPCRNGGRCFEDYNGDYICQCVGFYTGDLCEIFDPCASSPCGPQGRCVAVKNTFRGYRCDCHSGYAGETCQHSNPCSSNPCFHSGVCTSLPMNGSAARSTFSCQCPDYYFGDRCEITDPCISAPCRNGGRCLRSGNSRSPSYTCRCSRDFSGSTCEIHVSCQGQPCRNGGRCYPEDGGYFCRCLPQFYGRHCLGRSQCVSSPCQNGGSCFETPSSFICQCTAGFSGRVCNTKISRTSSCSSNPCRNSGSCVEVGNSFRCTCQNNYSGDFCERSLTYSCGSRTCLNGGSCSGFGRASYCLCPKGYTGDFCESIDPCETTCSVSGVCQGNSSSSAQNPCGKNGVCQSCTKGRACGHRGKTFLCICLPGYTGEFCDAVDPCAVNFGACRNGGTCVAIPALRTFTCICPSGERKHDCSTLSQCSPNPCLNGGGCRVKTSQTTADSSSSDTSYTCSCLPGFIGRNCERIDPCSTNPCLNGGSCVTQVVNAENGVSCLCRPEYQGSQCEIPIQCGPSLCHGDRDCIRAFPKFPGAPETCLNGGVCRIDSDGRSFCHCAPGFDGSVCEKRQSCENINCLNNGICVTAHVLLNGTLKPSHCVCAYGYTGFHCEKSLRPTTCDKYPCENKGRCVIDRDGAPRCRCKPGWSGDHCGERDRRKCRAGTCKNGGVCSTSKDSNRKACQCPPYYKGLSCQIALNPCSSSIDSPCLKGGICTPRRGATPPFHCRCLNGFTGTRCQVKPTDPCSPQPCRNRGRCSVDSNTRGYICRCKRPYTGERCEIKSEGICLLSPCKNLGTCLETSANTFRCLCLSGWTGNRCQRWTGGRGLCPKSFCSGRGVCYRGPGGEAACLCEEAFGERCEFTCDFRSSRMFAHPTQCSQYVMCSWGTPYVMQCPRQDLHFNTHLQLCDWASRAGCFSRNLSPFQEYEGFLWRLPRILI